jgi:hypothetical protein
MTPAKRWKKTRRSNTPATVGDFFEGLAGRITGARKTNRGTTADLCIQGTGTGIEVKGCGNHVARICASQLAAHRDSMGFPKPFSNFLYCLFCYRNKTGKAKNGRPRRSLLSMCGSRDAIHTTLAQHTDRLYILDLQVIERLRETQGCGDWQVPDEGHRGDRTREKIPQINQTVRHR